MQTRRDFARSLSPLFFAHLLPAQRGGAQRIPLTSGWEFEGRTVTLPHCVTRLSWQDWDAASWQKVWNYRRKFSLPAQGRRVFVEFEGVMTSAAPSLNGKELAPHKGGYLPFRREITDLLKPGENVLSVDVDARWQNVPPDGNPRGAVSVDYLEAGGIIRPVSLLAMPKTFIADVFAKPVNVLDASRRVEVTCTLDGTEGGEVRTELIDGTRVIAKASVRAKPGTAEVKLTLDGLGNIALWDNDRPKLYDVVTTFLVPGKTATAQEHRTRIGFREARFDVDGFFLNGKRTHLFGLNRHEVYPYVGYAMPPRVMRRDAEILKRDFHCNIVRCSHYPQSEAFLDACDALGLMVWEETPGWGFMGDDEFQRQVAENVHDMVLRDRNHASIVIWGVRVNESRNVVPLYAKTTETAKTLDGTRPCSGSMTSGSQRTWKEEWHEDVFAFDDYHAAEDGTVAIAPPHAGVPYMLAETVGQFNYTNRKGFDAKYVRGGDAALLQAQAVRHAQAHDRARAYPRFCGVIAWCAFDYASMVNPHRNVKTPGVADVFRIPKPGAAFYQAQVDPKVRPVIAPAFYWDARTVPGKQAAIFSNCEKLVVFAAGKQVASLEPDRTGYPHLDYPPFFCDLETVEADLRIDGLVGGKVVLSRSFSPDSAHDQFLVQADDAEIAGDGVDATRLVLQVTDRYGAPRPLATGEVKFEVSGPGEIVGDNPFDLGPAGGSGAVWVKATGNGRISITAAHPLGKRTVEISAR